MCIWIESVEQNKKVVLYVEMNTKNRHTLILTHFMCLFKTILNTIQHQMHHWIYFIVYSWLFIMGKKYFDVFPFENWIDLVIVVFKIVQKKKKPTKTSFIKLSIK